MGGGQGGREWPRSPRPQSLGVGGRAGTGDRRVKAGVTGPRVRPGNYRVQPAPLHETSRVQSGRQGPRQGAPTRHIGTDTETRHSEGQETKRAQGEEGEEGDSGRREGW